MVFEVVEMGSILKRMKKCIGTIDAPSGLTMASKRPRVDNTTSILKVLSPLLSEGRNVFERISSKDPTALVPARGPTRSARPVEQVDFLASYIKKFMKHMPEDFITELYACNLNELANTIQHSVSQHYCFYCVQI